VRIGRSLAFLFVAVVAASAAHAQEGSPAPAFSVRDLDGRNIRMQDLKGRPVVLDFWATWCAPCRASMPDLNTLQTRYAGQGLMVIGLSLDEDGTQPVRKFVDQLGVKFRIALANDRILSQYGPIRSAPTTIFINRRGVIVRRVVGYIDQETMDSFIRELF